MPPYYMNAISMKIFRIYDYGLVNRDSSILIIGGMCDGGASSLIAEYTDDEWEHVGNLQQGRYHHRAISNGDIIYIVGGSGTLRCV